MPALPIAKSYAGATLLADIIIDKYVNHIPFYRQIQMFKQQDISIAPATINGWFGDVAVFTPNSKMWAGTIKINGHRFIISSLSTYYR